MWLNYTHILSYYTFWFNYFPSPPSLSSSIICSSISSLSMAYTVYYYIIYPLILSQLIFPLPVVVEVMTNTRNILDPLNPSNEGGEPQPTSSFPPRQPSSTGVNGTNLPLMNHTAVIAYWELTPCPQVICLFPYLLHLWLAFLDNWGLVSFVNEYTLWQRHCVSKISWLQSESEWNWYLIGLWKWSVLNASCNVYRWLPVRFPHIS